jgi:hypothetical protein
MPETADFDQIARKFLERRFASLNEAWLQEVRGQLAEQLRLVWNARGAADRFKLDAELSSMMGVTASGPYVTNLNRALRTLDR